MDPSDILRFADVVHRDRGIDKEIVFGAIEQGMLTAARKKFGEDSVIECRLDRRTGDITCLVNGQRRQIDFGRIAAQTARQVMSQRIREAERDKHLDEYNRRLDTIVTGAIQRIEGGNLIVNMGRVEGIVPRSEQIRGEAFKVGDRIRAYLFEVRPMGQRVRIVLSRSRPEFVAKLFELEVPEIGDGVIVVRRIVREAGYKTKLAVESLDTKVDPIGACVGVRGSRIRNIIDELNGEKVDILKYEEQPEIMIATALKPAQINSITLNWDDQTADVLVDEDQLSLAIGRRGANVRLAARLAGWEINISGEGAAKAAAAGKAGTAEGEAAPSEGEAAPAEGEAAPSEGEAAPAEGEGATPAEGKGATPAEGEGATPAEGEGATPAEGEGATSAEGEGEATPAEENAPELPGETAEEAAPAAAEGAEAPAATTEDAAPAGDSASDAPEEAPPASV